LEWAADVLLSAHVLEPHGQWCTVRDMMKGVRALDSRLSKAFVWE